MILTEADGIAASMSSSTDTTRWPGCQPGQVAEIRKQVDKIAASPGFVNSQRRTQLLRYLVEAALDGRGAEMKEYAIGLDVSDGQHPLIRRPIHYSRRTQPLSGALERVLCARRQRRSGSDQFRKPRILGQFRLSRCE